MRWGRLKAPDCPSYCSRQLFQSVDQLASQHRLCAGSVRSEDVAPSSGITSSDDRTDDLASPSPSSSSFTTIPSPGLDAQPGATLAATTVAEDEEGLVYGGGREYWNTRYGDERMSRIEWYCTYPVLRRHNLFHPALTFPPTLLDNHQQDDQHGSPTSTRVQEDGESDSIYSEQCKISTGASAPRHTSSLPILIIGCGPSTLSAGLYEDGYENITNIDVSDVIIEQMQRTHAERYPRMQFLTMDVTAMTFPDESFDVVLDKGTLDAVCCNKDSMHFVLRMCLELIRVLQPGGKYICFSYGPPYLRRNYFLQPPLDQLWRLRTRKVMLEKDELVKCLSVLEDDESGTFYLYTLTKRDRPTAEGEDEGEEEDDDEGAEASGTLYDKRSVRTEEDEEDEELANAAFLENPTYKKPA